MSEPPIVAQKPANDGAVPQDPDMSLKPATVTSGTSPVDTSVVDSNPTRPLASSSGTQILSEAERLEKVFETINSLVGLRDFNRLADNYLIDKTYVGRDASKEFYRVLFDGDDDKLPFSVDSMLALLCTFTKASHLYYRFKFLIDYLEAGKGTEPIQVFMKAIRSIPQWQIPANKEFESSWYILWQVLGFPSEIDVRANDFQGQIRKLFPPQSQKIRASTTFSISLSDLDNVDLRVKPTTSLHEHLLIEGDSVNFFKLTFDDITKLRTYENNRAARALGIASLGSEIIASLNALYAKDKFFDKAHALGIFVPGSELHRSLLTTLFTLGDAKTQPKVLAYRAHTLRRLVDYRRSWWPSLVRDMQKQIEAQPVLFYGAILAVFFGLCTVIQTVASVWSLVLALRST